MNEVISKAEHDAALAEKQGQINALRHELDQLKRLIFSAKSERFVPATPAEQMALWDKEPPVDVAPPEVVTEDIRYTRRRPTKPHPGRAALPAHLPVEEEVLEPVEDTEGLVQIGEEVTDTLDYRPGRLLIRRRRRPKYARPVPPAPTDDDNGGSDGATEVLIAPLPPRPIERGIPEAGLLAELLIAKFVDHLPFYRQAQRFARDFDWSVRKSTLNDWFVATCTLLEPLYQALLRQAIDTDYLQVDESTIRVLDQDKKSGTHLGYHWVYRNPVSGLVLFDYRKGRGAHGVMERLADFTGYLQTDGYKAYQTYLRKHPGVRGVSCLAHIRRKFSEARDHHRELAESVLQQIQRLYAVDAHCKKRQRSAAERLALRRRVSLPIYEQLVEQVHREQADNLSKGAIGKALHYAKNELPKLAACFADGRIELDNNLIENSIRPLALGRKNYLFAGSHAGARRAAMLYSFLGSCRHLGLNPRVWLVDVLQRLPSQSMQHLDELLPHQWVPAAD